MDFPNLGLNAEVNWEKLDNLVRTFLAKDRSGHDYEHVQRVLKSALSIAQTCPKTDYDILVAGCKLHDIAFKDGFVKEHHLIGAKLAEPILVEIKFPRSKIKKVQEAIEDHVGNISTPVRRDSELSIESKILRDADNLDALGSIGIARQVAFCAANNIPFFTSREDYGFNKSVYAGIRELIKWPGRMLTPEGKRIGKSRLPVMIEFLKQLDIEYS